MRVLLTGGSGFIGAWLARRLLADGHRVRVFDIAERRQTVASIVGAEADAIEWRTGDIVEAGHVMAAAEGEEAIIHLAGMLTPACRSDPVRGVRVNVIGTLNVFEAARQLAIGRLVYTSTAGVYGAPEGNPPWPITHYGTTKLACEGAARAYWHDHGIASTGFRPYVVYGGGREAGLTAGPSLACRAAALGERYVIPYAGKAGLIYVEDMAEAYARALVAPPAGARVLNATGVHASNEDVIAEIRKLIPDADLAVDGPDIGIAGRIDDSDLHRAFPGLPRTSLAEGVARTIGFYRNRNRARSPG